MCDTCSRNLPTVQMNVPGVCIDAQICPVCRRLPCVWCGADCTDVDQDGDPVCRKCVSIKAATPEEVNERLAAACVKMADRIRREMPWPGDCHETASRLERTAGDLRSMNEELAGA